MSLVDWIDEQLEIHRVFMALIMKVRGPANQRRLVETYVYLVGLP